MKLITKAILPLLLGSIVTAHSAIITGLATYGACGAAFNAETNTQKTVRGAICVATPTTLAYLGRIALTTSEYSWRGPANLTFIVLLDEDTEELQKVDTNCSEEQIEENRESVLAVLADANEVSQASQESQESQENDVAISTIRESLVMDVNNICGN